MAPPAALEVYPESDTSTFTVPGRLTIQGVAKRRAAEGRLIAGVASVADVERFKGRTAHLHKAKARRWNCKWTSATLASGLVATHFVIVS
jgi:aromatic amino acid aminotransferase I